MASKTLNVYLKAKPLKVDLPKPLKVDLPPVTAVNLDMLNYGEDSIPENIKSKFLQDTNKGTVESLSLDFAKNNDEIATAVEVVIKSSDKRLDDALSAAEIWSRQVSFDRIFSEGSYTLGNYFAEDFGYAYIAGSRVQDQLSLRLEKSVLESLSSSEVISRSADKALVESSRASEKITREINLNQATQNFLTTQDYVERGYLTYSENTFLVRESLTIQINP